MNIRISRRAFLGACAASPALTSMVGRPRDESERVVVVVQLRGGNDGLSTVVPREDDRYYRARPDLAVRKQDCLALDDLNGFHPALPRLAQRYAEGGVGVLQGIGAPLSNLSHFRSQDIWDVASTDLPMPSRGWMGAWCDEHLGPDPSPLSMLALGRNVLPRAMRAERALACAVGSLDSYSIQSAPNGAAEAEMRARQRALAAMTPAPEDAGALQPLSKAVIAARASVTALARTRKARPGATYPSSKLARDLSLAARVITERLPARFIYVTQDGYDTHAFQPEPHRKLLSDLDGALNAFLDDLEAHDASKRVLVTTLSEFGRRVQQNGVGSTSGSDHGAGSAQLFFGGGARAGLHGPQPDLENLDENGNLIPITDFRSVYAAILERWLGGNSEAALGGVYPLAPVIAP